MAGFMIGEERFEPPMLDTLNLGECHLLYVLTSRDGATPVVVEDFEPADPAWDAEKKRDHLEARIRIYERPDFKIACAAIAYRRRYPETTFEEARLATLGADSTEVTVAMILGGDDVDPTMRSSQPSPTPPENASYSDAPSRPEESGQPGALITTEPDIRPPTTGTIE